MLLNFSCSNIRSIMDEVKFSLMASADDTREEELITYTPGGERILSAGAVYGSNATGKTSLLTAMAMMKNMVDNNIIVQPGDLLARMPHKLSKDKPTKYSIEFIWKETKYQYWFTYTDTEIIEETLMYSPNGRMGKIFSRNGSEVKVAEKFTKIETLCKEKLQRNRLVLSLAANNLSYIEVIDAFLYFKDGLVILLNNNNNWLEYSAAKMEHDLAIKNIFLNFMKNTGSDIQDIITKTEVRIITPAELPPDMPAEIRAMLMNKPSSFTEIKTVYNGFTLDIAEESLGTQKLIRMICPIMDIFIKGKTFVCDEIESHLHPLIVRQVVERFMKENRNGAQIIMATHNTEMLDLDTFRRDQIYFTDINPEHHTTRLYSLASMKCAKTDNVLKKYLQSTYCKVPNA